MAGEPHCDPQRRELDALSDGLKNTLALCRGVPAGHRTAPHRTDSLSACFPDRDGSHAGDDTRPHRELCVHQGLTATRTTGMSYRPRVFLRSRFTETLPRLDHRHGIESLRRNREPGRNGWSDRVWNLLLSGPSGVGKTHLALANCRSQIGLDRSERLFSGTAVDRLVNHSTINRISGESCRRSRADRMGRPAATG